MNRPRRGAERPLILKLGGVRPPPDPGRYESRGDTVKCKHVLLGLTALLLTFLLLGTWNATSAGVSVFTNTSEEFDGKVLTVDEISASESLQNEEEDQVTVAVEDEFDSNGPFLEGREAKKSPISSSDRIRPKHVEDEFVKDSYELQEEERKAEMKLEEEQKKLEERKKLEKERKKFEELKNFEANFPNLEKCDESSMSGTKGQDKLKERCKEVCAPPPTPREEDEAYLVEKEPDPFENIGVKYRCQTFWHQNFRSWTECKAALDEAKQQVVSFFCGANSLCEHADENAHGMGRGLVMAPLPHQIRLAYATIKWLHIHQNPPLPVQVFADKEEGFKVCEETLKEFPKVLCVLAKSAQQLDVPVNSSTHAQTFKLRALLSSTFQDVLYLDADAVPFIDPLPVFTSCEYKSSGAIFFPDYWGHICSSHRWGRERALCGQSTNPEHVLWALSGATWADRWPFAQEFFEAAFFVDRVRHYPALQVALLIAGGPLRGTVVGLKDIFKFGWLTAGHEFTLSADRPAMVIKPGKRKDGAPVFKRTSPLNRFKTLFLFANGVNPEFNNTEVQMAIPKRSKGNSWCLKVFQEYSARVIESSHTLTPFVPNLDYAIATWKSFIPS